MKAIFHFIFRSPMRAAIVCGLLVAIVFGFVSFPRPQLSKSVSGWQIQDVLTDEEQERLLAARRAALAGNGETIELTEEEFRDRNFGYSVTLPTITDSARRFVLQYTGSDDLASGTVYVAQREVFAAPWWSPHRFIYEAAYAEVDAFNEVLSLTFERDILGLTGLIIFDAFVGLLYGLVVGLIVAVMRGAGLSPSPRRADPIQHQSFGHP